MQMKMLLWNFEYNFIYLHHLHCSAGCPKNAMQMGLNWYMWDSIQTKLKWMRFKQKCMETCETKFRKLELQKQKAHIWTFMKMLCQEWFLSKMSLWIMNFTFLHAACWIEIIKTKKNWMIEKVRKDKNWIETKWTKYRSDLDERKN